MNKKTKKPAKLIHSFMAFPVCVCRAHLYHYNFTVLTINNDDLISSMNF